MLFCYHGVVAVFVYFVAVLPTLLPLPPLLVCEEDEACYTNADSSKAAQRQQGWRAIEGRGNKEGDYNGNKGGEQ